MKNDEIAFVRHDVIPQAAPPASQSGAVKWMRENLFATPLNGVLTVISLFVVFWIVFRAAPWFMNGIWTTTSLSECRNVLQGEVGGCFSVLSERWNQLLFGFKYPSDLYWRPTLAFVLLGFAAAPVMFFNLPRKLLIFTAVYPFLAFWLIWGGSLLVPLVVLLAFVAGAMIYSRYIADGFAIGVGGAIAGIVVILWGGSFITQSIPDFLALEPVQSRDMGGFMLNMILGTVCVSLSLPFGILLALGRQSRMPIIKWICVIFIEFIRGVPLITLLFVASVVLAYFLPPQVTFDLILRVIIMITMFSSAYIAEVIRGGLAALPTGQYEAADSLGLDYAQSMQLIILPQALKISIPGIVNVAVGLFKDTTLVSVISMFDLVGMIRGPILGSAEWNGVYWELLGFAALLFFVVCYGISQYSQWLERQLRTDHR